MQALACGRYHFFRVIAKLLKGVTDCTLPFLESLGDKVSIDIGRYKSRRSYPLANAIPCLVEVA